MCEYLLQRSLLLSRNVSTEWIEDGKDLLFKAVLSEQFFQCDEIERKAKEL